MSLSGSRHAHYFEPSRSLFNCATRILRVDDLDLDLVSRLTDPAEEEWENCYKLLHEYTHFLQYYTTSHGYLFHLCYEQYLMCVDMLAGERYAGREDLLARAPLVAHPHPVYDWLRPAALHFKQVSDAIGGGGTFPSCRGTDGRIESSRVRAEIEQISAAPFQFLVFVYQDFDAEYEYETPQVLAAIGRSSTRQILESHAHALAYLWLSDIMTRLGHRRSLEQLTDFFNANAVGPYRPFRLLFENLTTRQAAQIYCALCDLALNPIVPVTCRTGVDARFIAPAPRLARYAHRSFQELMPLRSSLSHPQWQQRVLETLRGLAADGDIDVDLAVPHIAGSKNSPDHIAADTADFRNILQEASNQIDRLWPETTYVRPLQRWMREYYRTATVASDLRQHCPLLLGADAFEDFETATGVLGWPSLVATRGTRREIYPRELVTDQRDVIWFGSARYENRASLHLADWITMLDRVGSYDERGILGQPPDHSPEDPASVFLRFVGEYDLNRGAKVSIIERDAFYGAQGGSLRIQDPRWVYDPRKGRSAEGSP